MKSIDIIVPTYNRPQDVKTFVEEIQKQEYPNYKVFFIDDCSDEKIEHLIPKSNKFEYIRLNKNKGQAYARNIGIKEGTGEILIFMDDDAWFKSTKALNLINDYLIEKPELGCLAFDIEEPNRELLSKRFSIQNNQEIGEFIACGVAFTKKAMKDIGGFPDFFHSYGEETYIVLKLIQKKYKIHFSKQIELFHNYNPGIRTKEWFKRMKFNSTRNDLYLVLLFFPFIYILPYLLGKLFSHIKYSILHENQKRLSILLNIKAFTYVIFHLNKTLKHRKPLTIKEFQYWLKIRL